MWEISTCSLKKMSFQPEVFNHWSRSNTLKIGRLAILLQLELTQNPIMKPLRSLIQLKNKKLLEASKISPIKFQKLVNTFDHYKDLINFGCPDFKFLQRNCSGYHIQGPYVSPSISRNLQGKKRTHNFTNVSHLKKKTNVLQVQKVVFFSFEQVKKTQNKY